MHFTVGDLILKLVSDYSPPKIIPVDETTKHIYKIHTDARDAVLNELTSSYWECIIDAHHTHHNRLRKLGGIEYIAQLSQILPDDVLRLIQRLYTLETILLSYNMTPKLIIEYDE